MVNTHTHSQHQQVRLVSGKAAEVAEANGPSLAQKPRTSTPPRCLAALAAMASKQIPLTNALKACGIQ